MKKKTGFPIVANTLRIVWIMVLMMSMAEKGYAQRIIGYFPNYNYSAANASNIQYAKLTHLLYFSLNPVQTNWGESNGDLWINDGFSWFTTSYFNDVVSKAKAANPDIKIILVTGGAPGGDGGLSARLEYIGNNPSICNRFCNNIISFMVNNDLDGWDLDWEFPYTVSARNSHLNMLTTMRVKMDSLKLAHCRPYELSIAVGGGYTDVTSPRVCWGLAHNEYINGAVIPLLDFINIMAYDGEIGSPPCSFSSHQHYDLMVKSFNDWRAAFPSLPASKINMGVGFYGNGFVDFNTIGNVGTRYNDPGYWANGGSGCPNMRAKIDYIRANGMEGVFIWELTQDNLCAGSPPACYSLLDCIYQYMGATWGSWTPPGSPCPMPVNFVDFSGSTNREGILLNWKTSSETDNKYFELQRSTDGKQFVSVAEVAGAGNSERILEYQYLDRIQGVETLYYRIRQYDVDGTSSWSKMIRVQREETYEFVISPNPFAESFTIAYTGTDDTKIAEVEIRDLAGLLWFSEKIPVKKYTEIGNLLPAGAYICTITTDQDRSSTKIIKTR